MPNCCKLTPSVRKNPQIRPPRSNARFSSAVYFSRGRMRRSALKLKQPRCPALRLWVTKELPQIIAVISGRMIWRTLGFFIVAS